MANDIDFGAALSKGLKLVRHYTFPASRRVTLNEYAHACMTLTLLTILASIIPLIGFILSSVIYISLICWLVARLHDVGRSGWWMFVPGYSVLLMLSPTDCESNCWEPLDADVLEEIGFCSNKEIGSEHLNPSHQDYQDKMDYQDFDNPESYAFDAEFSNHDNAQNDAQGRVNLEKNGASDDYFDSLLNDANKDLDRMLNG